MSNVRPYQNTLLMAKNLNSATRLLRILEQAGSHADNVQTVDAWAKILGVAIEHPIRRAVAVGELIRAMHQELDVPSRVIIFLFAVGLCSEPETFCVV